MQVYEMILEQLGGIGKLKAMLGAKDFMYSSKDPNFIEFNFKGCDKANHIKIEYNEGKDLYDIAFYKIKKVNGLAQPEEVKAFTDVFTSELKSTFRDYTGLELSL